MTRRDWNYIFFFIDRFAMARNDYNRIKADDELRKTSTLLGKRAIVYNIIMLVFMGGAAGLAIFGLTLTGLATILCIAGAVILYVSMLPYLVLSLNLAIKQLCLNKKAIGWVMLILPLLITIGSVVAVIIIGLGM